MITFQDLENHFYPVEQLAGGLVRCGDVLPKNTIHTYFKLGTVTAFIESTDAVDDDFAAFVLDHADPAGLTSLTKTALPANRYGFSHLLSVAPQYHALLSGRLDAQRIDTILCVPIFEPEFSGRETPGEFLEMRRRVVPTSVWQREAVPKLSLRHDNPKIGTGTGDGYVFARLDQVARHVEQLAASGDGFIEIINFRDAVIELLAEGADRMRWIEGRDDASSILVETATVPERIRAFVNP